MHITCSCGFSLSSDGQGFLLVHIQQRNNEASKEIVVCFEPFRGASTHSFNRLVCRDYRGKNHKCQKITIPLCANIGYNTTRFPNFFGQENEEDAAAKIHEFTPLVAVNCAPQLRFFLCSGFRAYVRRRT